MIQKLPQFVKNLPDNSEDDPGTLFECFDFHFDCFTTCVYNMVIQCEFIDNETGMTETRDLSYCFTVEGGWKAANDVSKFILKTLNTDPPMNHVFELISIKRKPNVYSVNRDLLNLIREGKEIHEIVESV